MSPYFWPGTPLHDGAVVIDPKSVVAAGCYLPLTEKTDISRWYGTRHRAALGVTEMSDALALVVSEERGEITVAVGGRLSKALSEAQLRSICSHYFSHEEGKDSTFMDRLREEIQQQWYMGAVQMKKPNIINNIEIILRRFAEKFLRAGDCLRETEIPSSTPSSSYAECLYLYLC